MQTSAGTFPFMNIGAKDTVCTICHGSGIIAEKYLCLCPFFTDKVCIVLHIVHSGKGMYRNTKELCELFYRQCGGIGIDLRLMSQKQSLFHRKW